MTESSSSLTHLSVVMTTDVSRTTGENATTSSSSTRSAEFYFGCAVIAIGVVGMAANALVFYALVASKQLKKHELMVNQNILDLASCLFLVVIYALKISSISLSGLFGYWLCMMLLSENLLWFAIEGSIINLAIVTIERYVKVVHPIWSKKHLRKWVTYLSMAFPWFISFIYNMSVALTTSAVVDGVCHGFIIWEDHVVKIVHGIYYFLSFYVVMLIIFIFCYARILVAIRRQARVMAAHGILVFSYHLRQNFLTGIFFLGGGALEQPNRSSNCFRY